MFSGTKDVMLCQFRKALSEDNSECQTDWKKITIFYEQGSTDGESEMTDVIEVMAAEKET